MSKAEILSKLQEIMKNVFDDETIKINNNTKRSDISDWDSLSQIRIVLSIEKKFNIKMDVDKAVMIETVGEFVKEIKKKLTRSKYENTSYRLSSRRYKYCNKEFQELGYTLKNQVIYDNTRKIYISFLTNNNYLIELIQPTGDHQGLVKCLKKMEVCLIIYVMRLII